mmetsp:Transcript_23995/g.35984  ORF Transcript_23995/g.35984 Transcript_23995/m.35984 type:complete len:112 (+) Transcript_23995:224-559(+)|eukprot:CAMPEP_0167761862 /NCGR_PEP_ID=MMETSP0110_2-20121227/12418_1 /TAXON_ID=629695 /ORGANISM="Gymnochlora sp., Strain CCMP2014" /LENGTH=111 /DNA_ID=CAMNT_0007648613 /DNA_START=881 /DNA_END=1216 /DNA_ORIENTATION=-
MASDSRRNGRPLAKEEQDMKYYRKNVREHRCHPRLRDFLCSMSKYEPKETWAMWRKCMNSEKGKEPTEPFLFFNPDFPDKMNLCTSRGSYRYVPANTNLQAKSKYTEKESK